MNLRFVQLFLGTENDVLKFRVCSEEAGVIFYPL